MQRVQWYSHFLQNILKQDPTTAAALLHRTALSITVGFALADVPINRVKVLLISDLRNHFMRVAAKLVRFRRVDVDLLLPLTLFPR